MRGDKLIPSSRRHPCPICQDVSGDCRLSSDESMLLCHDYIEQDSPLSAWKWVKTSSNGIWGVHVWDDGKTFDVEAWQSEQHIRQQQKLNHQRFLAENALLIEGRDRAFRHLSTYLGLRKSHREDLISRGLNEEQIQSVPFFSIHPQVVIPHEIPNNLPGVIIDYRSGQKQLLITASGYFCPSFDLMGLVNGGQVRLEGVSDSKYRWPKGTYPSHLPHGELPITLIKGTKPTQTLYLTEGILKPLVASLKHDLDVCGSAGGYFSGSPQQFREILTHYEKIVICPDGGDVKNRHVMQRWKTQIQFIRSLGNQQIWIEWHDQENKEDDDLDELSSLRESRLISVEEFLALAGFEVAVGRFAHQPQAKGKSEGIDRESLSVDEFEPDFEPDTLAYKNYIEWEKEQSEIEESLERQRQIERGRIRAEEIAQKQIPLNTLVRTPNVVVNQEVLSVSNLIPKQGLVMLNSPKNTRKSLTIKELRILAQKLSKPVISIVPRVLLGKNQEASWEIRYIEQRGLMKIENYESIALCFDSLGKLHSKDWSGALVIIDECRQGLKHLIRSSTLEERRSWVLKVLEDKFPEVIETGGMIIAADADLTEAEIEYLEHLTKTEAFVVDNQFIPKKGIIHLNTGKKDETLTELFDRFAKKENLVIFCESKTDSIAIYQQLKEIDPQSHLWLINGDTAPEDAVKAIIEGDINRAIQQQKPRALIYTTSMSTGVSIDGWIGGEFHEEVYEWFDYGFILAVGKVLEPVDIAQGMVRVRKPLNYTVFAGEGRKENEGHSGEDPEVIKRQILKNTHYSSTLLRITQEILENRLGREVTHLEVFEELIQKTNPKTEMIDDPHLEHFCRVQARENYLKRNFVLNLRQQLIEEGYQVQDVYCHESNALGDWHRTLKKQEKLTEARAISNSEDISLEEAQEILRRNSTLEERRQAHKAFLKAELPGVELTPELILKAVIQDRRRWLNTQKLFWYCQHPSILQKIEQEKYLRKIAQFASGVIFLPDLKFYLPMVNELHQLGLFELIDLNNPNKEIHKNDPEVKEFMKRAHFRRVKIYTVFSLTVTSKTDPINFLQRLLKRVGLDLRNTRTQKVKGEKIRYYTLDQQLLFDPERLAVLAALDRRFLKNAEIAGNDTSSSLEQGQHFEKSYINIGVLSPTAQDLDLMVTLIEQSEDKNEFEDALRVLWGAVNGCEQSYDRWYRLAFNALSFEAKRRVNQWLLPNIQSI